MKTRTLRWRGMALSSVVFVATVGVAGLGVLIATPRATAATPPLAFDCEGEVVIETEGDPPMPLGPATLNCTNPCEEGCGTYFVMLGNGQDAAVCGCTSNGGPGEGCQVALTPANSSGGPIPYGSCPGTQTCQAVGNNGSHWTARCRD